ncbi:MAG: A24 family peptidase [Gemmatimonadaceae bacterium]
MAASTALGITGFAFGAVIGSFLNVCIARWPENLSVVRPRSRCPFCTRQLTWSENVPLVSWIVQRGRCRGCRASISMQYPAVELATGLLFAWALVSFGPTFAAVRVAIFATMLLGVAVTDARHYVIPDGFTVFGLLWGLGAAMIAFYLNSPSRFAGPWEALLGACVGAGAISIAGWLGEVALKKEAMGFGDVTLMAAVGAAVGPTRALLTVFVGALFGAIAFLGVVYPVVWWRGRRRGAMTFEPPVVPFGVFLAPAAVATLLWGQQLVTWYLQRATTP